MRPASLLLALVPLVGLVELGLHQYFARRAPGFDDYAALAPELRKAKQAGQPVVVAPAWAEPLLRRAAPDVFPLAELARADDTAYASFLEVALLGASAPELSGFSIRERHSVGPFELRVHDNPEPDLTRFDFVTAVDVGSVEVTLGKEVRKQCRMVRRAASAGGLHGHVALPSARYECDGEHFATVSLIEDQGYRPHRCILVTPPSSGSLNLSFNGVTATQRLVGFTGYSYFLGRDSELSGVQLEVYEDGQLLGGHTATGAEGWARFELGRKSRSDRLEVRLRTRHSVPSDFCFALEAR